MIPSTCTRLRSYDHTKFMNLLSSYTVKPLGQNIYITGEGLEMDNDMHKC